MGNRFAIAAIAAIVAVLAAPGMRGTASAAPQAGEVLALFGPCFVVIEVRKTLLKPGDAVHVGDTVDVGAGAKLRLRMNDGSVITIASGGHLTIVAYRVGDHGESREATLSLGQGLLRAVVSTFKGPPHFEVKTATGVAAVLDRLVHRSTAGSNASRRARRPRQSEERRDRKGDLHPCPLGGPRRSRQGSGPGQGVDRG